MMQKISVEQRKQRGIGLIELLISITIGLFFVAGALQIFLSSKQSFNLQNGMSRLQENARVALEMMAYDVRMAGFLGCFSRNIPIKNTLNSTDHAVNIGTSLEGYEATSLNSWASEVAVGLDALPDDVDEDNVAGGTDILVIRRVVDKGIRIAKAMPFPSADIKIVTPAGDMPIGDEDIVLLSDCQKAAVFQITNLTVGGSGVSNVVHNAGGSSTPGNYTKLLTDDGSVYDTDASLFAMTTQIFFVAPGIGVNNQGDIQNALWRKVGNLPPEELVSGVENMQILYGEDLDQDFVPNHYVAANQVLDMSQVISVRIELTINSFDRAANTADGFIRKTFVKTVTLRNRMVTG